MEGMMKLKYEHDTERWLRSQAKIYALRQNLGMAATFERCADDVKALRTRLAEVEAQRDELKGLLVSTMSRRDTFEMAIVLHRKIDEALAKLEEK
jgi:hypothetical protein